MNNELRPVCLTPLKFSGKVKCFVAQNIPHKTKSGSNWCLPIWYIKIFGGNGDTGNGYCWYPSKFKKYIG